MKIPVQRLWESNLAWDEPVLKHIECSWRKWYDELPCLQNHTSPRSYFPKHVELTSVQLRGFCDDSEVANSEVVYLRAINRKEAIHTALVLAKSNVAPIK